MCIRVYKCQAALLSRNCAWFGDVRIKTYSRHIEILFPVPIFTWLSSAASDFAPTYDVSSKSDHTQPSYEVTSSHQDAGHGGENWVWWPHPFKKVTIYLQTKFYRDISIYGGDITTSGFWKQTAAILKCYFRFPFRPAWRHRQVILHQRTEIYANRTIRRLVMTS